MSTIPRHLARRIDRLSRRAHAFHRWAHHPLCAAYAGELYRLGRWRICRGCALFACGGVLGCIVGLLPVPVSARGTLELLALLLILASPTLVFRAWRPGKWFTRLLPSALSTFLVMHAVRRPELPGLIVALLVVALGILGMLCYRGHGPDRRICSVCPEFSSPTTCSGFAPIRRRERAFRRLAARWMDG